VRRSAIVLEHDLDNGEHCVVDIINATAYVLPALELVDSRIADWNIRIVDTVADNASSGLYVVGTRPVRLVDLDLRSVSMSMTQNGTKVAAGTGAAMSTGCNSRGGLRFSLCSHSRLATERIGSAAQDVRAAELSEPLLVVDLVVTLKRDARIERHAEVQHRNKRGLNTN